MIEGLKYTEKKKKGKILQINCVVIVPKMYFKL